MGCSQRVMWSTRTLSPRQIYGVQAICLGTKTCERPATKPLALKNELCSVIDKTYFLSSSLNEAQTTGNDDNVAAEGVSTVNKPRISQLACLLTISRQRGKLMTSFSGCIGFCLGG